MLDRKQITGITSGPNGPANPNFGDLWFETQANGNVLYAWPWQRGANGWQGPEIIQQIDYRAITGNTFSFIDTVGRRIRILGFQLKTFSPVEQTASAYWGHTLFRVSEMNDRSQILGTNTIGNLANRYATRTVNINETYNPSVDNFTLIQLETRVIAGAPGTLTGSAIIRYHWLR